MRPRAVDLGSDEMAAWYKARDFLPDQTQTVMAGSSTLEESVATIMQVSGLSC
jgi:hypothetical protein